MNYRRLLLKILNLIVICFFFHIICSAQNEGSEKRSVKSRSVMAEGLDFACSPIPQIYPGIDDFNEIGSGNVGKILISDYQNGGYYTNYQTGNAKMQVKAVFEGDIEDGTFAYFKVLDPDDKSTYEIDEEGKDNKFPYVIRLNNMNVYPNDDDPSNDIVSVPIINNEAEVPFIFSRGDSGENYIIEVSLDSSFPSELTGQSITYTTWKRIHIEFDKMYKKGSTLMEDFTSDNETITNDRLSVQSIIHFTDLPVGQLLTLFTKDEVIASDIEFVAIDYQSSTPSIIVKDFTVSSTIKEYTGILINGETDVFDIDLGVLEEYTQKAFGSDPSGSGNGGAFIEYNTFSYEGSGIAPNFTTFKAANSHFPKYAKHWQQNAPGPSNDPNSDAFNVIYLLAGDKYQAENGTYRAGAASPALNITLISVGLIESQSFLTAEEIEINKGEVVVHELGHQFDVNADHVDEDDEMIGDVDNHHIVDDILDNDDKCQMSYRTISTNGISEFDILNTIVIDGNGNEIEQMEGCIWVIRRAFDPL